ncbi:hypothetical protein EDB80DRAFT_595897 [Ilyonectria destructans]|nr:hypothetical protein EDB80DRAFT_595897 [Ilyonectria destructans]
MKLTTSFILPISFRLCLSASNNLWSASIESHTVPWNEPIDPEELKARLVTTTPAHYNSNEKYAGVAYFCRDEDWGPPCFAYYPEFDFTCFELGPELAGHVGSVFVEPGVICRMSILSSNNRCAAIESFAWPEIRGGWPDLFHQGVPESGATLGYATTHFMCAECTTCIPNSVSREDLVIMDL